MKHYNDFLIVGIDHGYGNIKTANTVTPTGITKLDAAPTFTKNTLFFEGNYYQIGSGSPFMAGSCIGWDRWGILGPRTWSKGFPGDSVAKNRPAKQETQA